MHFAHKERSMIFDLKIQDKIIFKKSKKSF